MGMQRGGVLLGGAPREVSVVVTCFHVIDGIRSGKATFDAYASNDSPTWFRLLPSLLLFTDPVRDLAACALEGGAGVASLPSPACLLHEQRLLGRKVEMVHHPHSGSKSSSRGHVVLESPPSHFLHTADGAPGSSGGPILSGGVVIGVASSSNGLMLRPGGREETVFQGVFVATLLASLSEAGYGAR